MPDVFIHVRYWSVGVRLAENFSGGGHSGFEAVWNVHNGVTIC